MSIDEFAAAHRKITEAEEALMEALEVMRHADPESLFVLGGAVGEVRRVRESLKRDTERQAWREGCT